MRRLCLGLLLTGCAFGQKAVVRLHWGNNWASGGKNRATLEVDGRALIRDGVLLEP